MQVNTKLTPIMWGIQHGRLGGGYQDGLEKSLTILAAVWRMDCGGVREEGGSPFRKTLEEKSRCFDWGSSWRKV